MGRVKRSVEAQYTQVHFNTADLMEENIAETLPEDPMAVAEAQVEGERKRKAADLAGAKRARVGVGASLVDKKEMLAEFHASKKFVGARSGFVFKLGAQGLGFKD